MADTTEKDTATVVNNITDMTKKDSFTVISDAMQGSIIGAGIGLVGGLVFAYLGKRNLFLYGMIGMFGVGAITSIFLNNVKSK